MSIGICGDAVRTVLNAGIMIYEIAFFGGVKGLDL